MTARRGLVAVAAILVVLVAAGGLSMALVSALRDPDPIYVYDADQLVAPVPTTAATAPAPGAAAVAPWTVDPAWVDRTSLSSGIPAVAVRAYATAAVRLAQEEPGCRLGWTTLAGIGEIESVHGTIGGRTLLADGRSSQPILGPALDGVGPVAAMRADAGATALHGDPTWDHAVGPLQFLPSTWAQWGVDEGGDGTADPQDLDDAAYAAGRYLCADGGDLTGGPAWQAAVLSYNHSSAYVASVYAAASRFATAG